MGDSKVKALQKIAAMRQRRIDRELVEAGTAHQRAVQEREHADAEKARAKAALKDAARQSYASPAEEQTWIWRSASARKQNEAFEHAEAMLLSEKDRKGELTKAGQAFQKAKAKMMHLDELARTARKNAERRTDDQLAEEQQDAKLARRQLR